MQSVSVSIYNWLVLSSRLLGEEKIPKKPLLIWTFLRLHITHQYVRIFKIKKTHEIIFGRTFYFFDYGIFLYLFEEIFMQQIYHFESSAQKPFVIDCGSNIGMSVLYFKWLYPEAHVVAFEPDPKTFQTLKRNVEGLKNVEIHNVAISDKAGEMQFFNNASNQGSLVMGIYATRNSENAVNVKCDSLAGYISQKVDFFKIDIEGAETLCFKDLDRKQTFLQIDQMVMECHHNIRSEPNLSEILPILEKNHFKYQISAQFKSPYRKNLSQDIMIYAYK